MDDGESRADSAAGPGGQPYDFFGSPTSASPSMPQPAAFPDRGAPVGPPAPQVNSFGTPLSYSPVPLPAGAAPYPPAYGPGYAPVRTGRSAGVKAAIIVAIVIGGLVALSIVAAVVIPVYENHHAQGIAARTTVSLPASVVGYTRMTGAADQVVQNLVGQQPASYAAQGAVYGTGATPFVIVMVGGRPMTSFAQHDFMKGFIRGEQQAGGVTVTRTDPGPLGGTLECGVSADAKRTDCGFTDGGAFGAIDVAATGPAAQAMVLQVRSLIEQRR
jgi:hypothetical protein